MGDAAPLSLRNLCHLPTTQDRPLWASPGLPSFPRALEFQCLSLSSPLSSTVFHPAKPSLTQSELNQNKASWLSLWLFPMAGFNMRSWSQRS